MSHEKGIEAALNANDRFGIPFYEELDQRDIEAIIKGYLDASGMVMVPREPTDEMINSGLNCDAWSEGKDSAVDMISDTFKAMIDASPNPFQTPEESREKK